MCSQLNRLFYFERGNDTSIPKLSDRFVSILKPLKGKDKNLHENLESFFVMNYKNYELLFCVKDRDDPAVGVVKNLMKTHPDVDARLITQHDGKEVGINPKINNMNPGFLESKYDLIFVSDDKMIIQPDTLQEMVNRITFDTKIGCVFQVACINSQKQGCSALFDKMFFSVHSCTAFICNIIKVPFVINGMSALYEKKVFEKAGGMEYFANSLQEDIDMHWFCHQNGWKVALSRFRGLQNQEETGLIFQYARFRRWFTLMETRATTFMIVTSFLWYV